MAFESIRPAIKFIALLRPYNGQGSVGGGATYGAPVMIKCYPSVDNRYVLNSAGSAVFSKTVLYVLPDVAIKEQDMIILESGSPNWFGKNFTNNTERDTYYTKNATRKVKDKTWCCVAGVAQFWDGTTWSTSFDGDKVDGEVVGKFEGKTEIAKSVPKYFDGFGWDNDAENNEGLSIQEIGL